MWAKRFPLPEFQYESLKDLPWSKPSLLDKDQISEKTLKQASNENTPGCFAVPAPDAFFEQFNIVGDFRHAVLCVTPEVQISILGRSHAWKKQRLLIVDSLDPTECKVLVDWKTARPMSTRLGPKEGSTIQGGIWYAIFTHMISDRLVGNRSLLQTDNTGQKGASDGFSILSSSEPEFSDFHDCNLYVSW